MNILAMSGFVPEHICDVIRFTQYSGERNLPHFCGYVSDFLSQVLQDSRIDGAVFPRSCDSSRTIRSYLEGSGKFLFQFAVPSFRTPGSEAYFAEQIRAFRAALEAHYGVRPDSIRERIAQINRRNEQIRETYAAIETFSYADYLSRLHHLLTLPLSAQAWTGAEKRAPGGKRVFLVGSFLSNVQIAREMENAGLTVVGDTLPESGRLLSAAPADPSAADCERAVAESILSARPSPTQNAFREIIAEDLAEIERKQAQGVVFVTQKYCEPYDYLFAVYGKALREKGIPFVRLSLDHTEDSGKAVLALEAFANALKGAD